MRLNRSRRGAVADALELALEEAEAEGRIRLEHRVWAALARRAALLVDASWRADDVLGVMRGTKELRELVDILPLRDRGADLGKEDDDGDDSGGARILELLDRPPGVGD